jgi:hypothetical protein
VTEYNSVQTLTAKISELERRMLEQETSPRLSSAGIGFGGITIHDGGSLTVVDGGGVAINDGGDVSVNGGGSLDINDGGGVSVIGGGSITIRDGGGIVVDDSGSLDINDGGAVIINDGGGVTVNDGGYLDARYADGTIGATFGPLASEATHESIGFGLLIQGPFTGLGGDLDNPDIFRALTLTDGSLNVFIGQTDKYIDTFISRANTTSIYALGTLWLSTTNQATLNGDGGVFVTSGGQIQLNSGISQTFIAHTTTSNAANAYLQTSGLLQRSTSSLRYKQDVEDAVIDPAAVLQLQPRTWRDKLEVQRDPDVERRYVGFIAEELDSIGLKQFVNYDDEDRPDSISYDRLSAALIVVIQDLASRVSALEARQE